MKRRNARQRKILYDTKVRKNRVEVVYPLIEPEITSFDHESILHELEFLSDLPIEHYKRVAREDISIPLPLKSIDSKGKDATITISVSDTHLGHSGFLPDTFESTIKTLMKVITYLKTRFNIKNVKVVLNGDIVSGRDVYRKQVLDNLLTKGHWQVFIAEILITQMLIDIKSVIGLDDVYIVKGTHEEQAENYMLYLKTALEKKFNTKYLSRGNIVNIAEPIGNYNIFFTHGKGKSDYYPVSLVMIRDIWKSISDYKNKDIIIERVCMGHTHWLTTDLEIEGIILDVSGGFQLWEYSHSQRPSGMLLYLFTDGECSVIPIRPNKDVENNEKKQNALEYKVMAYYSQKLLEHVRSLEGVNTE